MKQLLAKTAFLFCLSLSIFYPDSFRVGMMHTHILNSEVFEPITLQMGYNDAVSFTLKSDTLFLEGIELEIKQSAASLKYPNTIAYTIYTEISPEPAKNEIDYTAQKISTALLPNRFSHSIRIPLKEPYNFTRNGNSEIIPYSSSLCLSPFMLRLNPVMKGLPDDIEGARFTVIARPLLIAEGGLKINLQYPDKEQKPVSVQLNGDYLAKYTELQLRQPGQYSLQINSDAYRTETRTCVVERGKTTQLDIQLKSITPLLRIQAPENVMIMLDGEEITLANTPIPLESGSHIIMCKIGTYQLTRQIIVEEGKSYLLTFTMDMLIQEITE